MRGDVADSCRPTGKRSSHSTRRRSSRPATTGRAAIATAQCLAPFLKALAYRGTELNRIEATPHFQDGMDIADLRTALVNLGYKTERQGGTAVRHRSAPDAVPSRDEMRRAKPSFCWAMSTDAIFAFINGHYRALSDEEALRDGYAYFARPIDAKTGGSAATVTVGRTSCCGASSRSSRSCLLISAVSNILSIAVPLFVMTVYDRVIALRALDALADALRRHRALRSASTSI